MSSDIKNGVVEQVLQTPNSNATHVRKFVDWLDVVTQPVRLARFLRVWRDQVHSIGSPARDVSISDACNPLSALSATPCSAAFTFLSDLRAAEDSDLLSCCLTTWSFLSAGWQWTGKDVTSVTDANLTPKVGLPEKTMFIDLGISVGNKMSNSVMMRICVRGWQNLFARTRGRLDIDKTPARRHHKHAAVESTPEKQETERPGSSRAHKHHPPHQTSYSSHSLQSQLVQSEAKLTNARRSEAALVGVTGELEATCEAMILRVEAQERRLEQEKESFDQFQLAQRFLPNTHDALAKTELESQVMERFSQFVKNVSDEAGMENHLPAFDRLVFELASAEVAAQQQSRQLEVQLAGMSADRTMLKEFRTEDIDQAIRQLLGRNDGINESETFCLLQAQAMAAAHEEMEKFKADQTEKEIIVGHEREVWQLETEALQRGFAEELPIFEHTAARLLESNKRNRSEIKTYQDELIHVQEERMTVLSGQNVTDVLVTEIENVHAECDDAMVMLKEECHGHRSRCNSLCEDLATQRDKHEETCNELSAVKRQRDAQAEAYVELLRSVEDELQARDAKTDHELRSVYSMEEHEIRSRHQTEMHQQKESQRKSIKSKDEQLRRLRELHEHNLSNHEMSLYELTTKMQEERERHEIKFHELVTRHAESQNIECQQKVEIEGHLNQLAILQKRTASQERHLVEQNEEHALTQNAHLGSITELMAENQDLESKARLSTRAIDSHLLECKQQGALLIELQQQLTESKTTCGLAFGFIHMRSCCARIFSAWRYHKVAMSKRWLFFDLRLSDSRASWGRFAQLRITCNAWRDLVVQGWARVNAIDTLNRVQLLTLKACPLYLSKLCLQYAILLWSDRAKVAVRRRTHVAGGFSREMPRSCFPLLLAVWQGWHCQVRRRQQRDLVVGLFVWTTQGDKMLLRVAYRTWKNAQRRQQHVRAGEVSMMLENCRDIVVIVLCMFHWRRICDDAVLRHERRSLQSASRLHRLHMSHWGLHGYFATWVVIVALLKSIEQCAAGAYEISVLKEQSRHGIIAIAEAWFVQRASCMLQYLLAVWNQRLRFNALRGGQRMVLMSQINARERIQLQRCLSVWTLFASVRTLVRKQTIQKNSELYTSLAARTTATAEWTLSVCERHLDSLHVVRAVGAWTSLTARRRHIREFSSGVRTWIRAVQQHLGDELEAGYDDLVQARSEQSVELRGLWRLLAKNIAHLTVPEGISSAIGDLEFGPSGEQILSRLEAGDIDEDGILSLVMHAETEVRSALRDTPAGFQSQRRTVGRDGTVPTCGLRSAPQAACIFSTLSVKSRGSLESASTMQDPGKIMSKTLKPRSSRTPGSRAFSAARGHA